MRGLAIETTDLCKRLGGREVVQSCNLVVPTGEVYGFIGPNGAGKTTVMRLLLGTLRADRGIIRVLGHDMRRYGRAALSRIGSFIESPALYDHLSARANLDMARRLLGLPESEIDRVLDVVGMRAHAKRKVREYSLGMKQRTALARSLLGTPELLMLDEPTNGLDPEGIAEMRQLIRELPHRIGATVFLSSHLLAEVEQVASHAGLLREGKLVMQGPLVELLASKRTLLIRCDNPELAGTIIRTAGFETRAVGRYSISLTCPSGEDFSLHAAAVNCRLVEAGVAVSEITERRPTLEDLYSRSAGAGLKKDAA